MEQLLRFQDAQLLQQREPVAGGHVTEALVRELLVPGHVEVHEDGEDLEQQDHAVLLQVVVAEVKDPEIIDLGDLLFMCL